MGLDVSHGAWNGPYSQFNQWRVWLATNSGLPLHLMEGFYEWRFTHEDRDNVQFVPLYEMAANTTAWIDTLNPMVELGGPIQWDLIGDHPMRILLQHSDCGGRIRWWECKRIAMELGRLLRRVDDDTHMIRYKAGENKGEFMWTDWRDGRGIYDGRVPATKRFIRGCLLAWKSRDDMRFG